MASQYPVPEAVMNKASIICGQGLLVLLAAVIVSGCDSGPLYSTSDEHQNDLNHELTNHVNVFEDHVVLSMAQAGLKNEPATTTNGNLLVNADFESHGTGWSLCNTGVLTATSDAYSGESAGKLAPGTCIYQAIPVRPNETYSLSCFIRVVDGNNWTAIGMGFSDVNWNTVEEVSPSLPTLVSSYRQYNLRGIAPTDAAYLSVWMYSDNGEAIVDNCRLVANENSPKAPSQNTSELLVNGNFDILENDLPIEWSGNSSWSTEKGDSGTEVILTTGSSFYQTLSASAIGVLTSGPYTLSCEVLKIGGWGVLSIRGQEATMPNSEDYQTVSLSGDFSQVNYPVTTASVGIQLRPTTFNNPLRVRNCSLTVESVAQPNPSAETNDYVNLSNAGFEELTVEGHLDFWSKGCGGAWKSVVGASGKAVQLSKGACISQYIDTSFADRESGKGVNFTCNVQSTSGYADLTIFVDGVEYVSVVPVTGNTESVSVVSEAKNFSNVLAVLYSEGDTIFDDCSLTASE